MTEALAQLQSRNASAAEIASAKRTMARIRKEIARFHTLRRKNNEIAAGLRITPLGVDPARSLIAENRDAHLEQQAVTLLRQFLQIVHGREPTKQELKSISPMMEQRLGMGVWPAVIAVGLTTVGLSVHQIFSHLREQEERIFLQTASPLERGLHLGQKNLKVIAALGVAGTVGYVWHREAQRNALLLGERPPGIIESISAKIKSFLPDKTDEPDGLGAAHRGREMEENPDESPIELTEITAYDALDMLDDKEKKKMAKLLAYYEAEPEEESEPKEEEEEADSQDEAEAEPQDEAEEADKD